jgi:hypothetical protein
MQHLLQPEFHRRELGYLRLRTLMLEPADCEFLYVLSR